VKRALILLGVGITVGLIGSGTYYVATRGDAVGATVVGQASDRLPSETLSDWVSFGDHVVIAKVESERELDTPPEVVQRGEGLIGRRISAQVTTTLWSRSQAPALPSTVDLLVWGWVLQDGKRLPFTSDGAPRLGVGSTYVIPLTQVKGGEWIVLAPSAVLPVTAQTIRAPGGAEVGTIAPLARAYAGRAAADLGRDLAAATPDPVAARHFDEDPDARWAAVVEARAAGQP
jgi:hypothetical protein